VSENFNLGHHIIIEVGTNFAKHVALPKKEFIGFAGLPRPCPARKQRSCVQLERTLVVSQ
jgi:hypothetical protein